MEFVPEPGSGRVAEYLVVGTYFLEREEDENVEADDEKSKLEEGQDDDIDKNEAQDQAPAAQNRSGSLNLLGITGQGM